MRGFLMVFLGTFAWTASRPAPANAQRVHEIRLEANPEKDVFRFVPGRINARPGDVLVFKASSGSPHSIIFEAANLSGSAHEALNGAMIRRAGDLSSPLLSPNGAEYRLVVPALPAGRYEFFCLPHRAYDMRGTLQIAK